MTGKTFRKTPERSSFPRPPSPSSLVPQAEPVRLSLHKAEGQRGEPPIHKEVHHVRTQGEGSQGSGEVPRPAWLRGRREQLEVRKRKLHRPGGQGRRHGGVRGRLREKRHRLRYARGRRRDLDAQGQRQLQTLPCCHARGR